MVIISLLRDRLQESKEPRSKSRRQKAKAKKVQRRLFHTHKEQKKYHNETQEKKGYTKGKGLVRRFGRDWETVGD